MNKNFFFVIGCVLMAVIHVGAQTTTPYNSLQNVVPPSPEAISFARQNFADVNLYAGKHSYSLPVYTMSQGGVNFPITLSYSGAGGIKVEEVASSVGLGWSLQYTGVISRSIRGRADDTFAGDYKGYIHLPGIDSTFFKVDRSDHAMYNLGYTHGLLDAEPDDYYINAPGLSGIFYINKHKKVVFAEKSDLQVKILFSEYTIIGFEVTDLSGNVYVFNETETTKTVAIAGAPSEYIYPDVSAWYLSEIRNAHGKKLFRFEYLSKDSTETKQLLRSPYQYSLDNQASFQEDNSTYTELYTKRPQLKKIITASGEIKFVSSAARRYDLAGDRALDSIIVKNNEDKVIRRFNFDYSYFTPTGIIQEGQGHYYGYGDPSMRLKLDRFEQIAGAGTEKETWSFVYNTTHLLPDRLTTFAMDHWGYYNGAPNTTWEARHRAKIYRHTTAQEGEDYTHQLYLDEFGTANREPNAAYAQACMLKEVVTPTSGSVSFEYEGHTSNDPRLPNALSTTIIDYTVDEQKTYFTVNMIREPFAYVKVQALVGSDASIKFTLGDSLENSVLFTDTIKQGALQHTYKLMNGTYYVTAKILTPHPDPGFNYGPRLIKDIETLVINKPVGGVRIRQMQLSDPVQEQNLFRKYYYNEAGSADAQSLSTGVVGNVPEYGCIAMRKTIEYDIFILGYIRQLSTTYPLAMSNSSYTGYSKVTVADNDELKSEYHYTTFKEFPLYVDTYMPDNSYVEPNRSIDDPDPLETKTFVGGEWIDSWPRAPFDERDYLRGKLLLERQYKKEDNSFVIVSEKENRYKHNFKTIGLSPPLPELPVESVAGMATVTRVGVGLDNNPNPDEPTTYFVEYKMYFRHTSRYDVEKTIEKTYTYDNGVPQVMVTETSLDYGHSPWYRDSLFHYMVTKVVQKRDNEVDTTQYLYPFDWRYNQTDITPSDTSFLKKLEKQNRIGMPFLEKKKSNTYAHIQTTKNQYQTFNTDQLYPAVIQTRLGTAPTLEDRISFSSYDTLGNLLEQRKTADAITSYLWDYQLSYPVAQVVNASQAEVAYTSFEADSKGSWNYSGSTSADATAPTGKKSYTFTGTITRTMLPAGTYRVTYWKKNGTITVNSEPGTLLQTRNGWTLYEHVVTNPVANTIIVSGDAATLDELRLTPVKAVITTYTHEPLVGVTSITDANNVSQYFFYDGLGRLIYIKDADGNILKTTTYHYRQPSQGQQ